MRRAHFFYRNWITVFVLLFIGSLLLVTCSSVVNNTPPTEITEPSTKIQETPTKEPTPSSVPTLDLRTEVPWAFDPPQIEEKYDYIFIAIDNSDSAYVNDPDLLRFKLSQFYIALINLFHQNLIQKPNNQLEQDTPKFFLSIYPAQENFNNNFEPLSYKETTDSIQEFTFNDPPKDGDHYYYNNILNDYSTLLDEYPDKKIKLIIFTDGIWDWQEDNTKEQRAFTTKIAYIRNNFKDDETGNTPIEVVFTNPQALWEEHEVTWWGETAKSGKFDLYYFPENGANKSDFNTRRTLDIDANTELLKKWVSAIMAEFNINHGEWEILNDEAPPVEITFDQRFTSEVYYDFTPIVWIGNDPDYWPDNNTRDYEVEVSDNGRGKGDSSLILKYLEDGFKKHPIIWANSKDDICQSDVITVENVSGHHSYVFFWAIPSPVTLTYDPSQYTITNLDDFDITLSIEDEDYLNRFKECARLRLYYLCENCYEFEEISNNKLSASISFEGLDTNTILEEIQNNNLRITTPPRICTQDGDCHSYPIQVANEDEFALEFRFMPKLVLSENPFKSHLVTIDYKNNTQITFNRIKIPIQYFNESFYTEQYGDEPGEAPWIPFITIVGEKSQCYFVDIPAEFGNNVTSENDDELPAAPDLLFVFHYSEDKDFLIIDIAQSKSMIDQNKPITNCSNLSIDWEEDLGIEGDEFSIEYTEEEE